MTEQRREYCDGRRQLFHYNRPNMFALYIIVFWLLIAVVAVTYLYYQKDMKMTSTTTGEVISATYREIRDDSGRRDETVVLCKYVVSGREYQVSVVVRGKNVERFPAGRNVPIRYNPSDPKMSRIPTA